MPECVVVFVRHVCGRPPKVKWLRGHAGATWHGAAAAWRWRMPIEKIADAWRVRIVRAGAMESSRLVL